MFTSAVWLINLSTTHNIPVSNTDYLLVRLNKRGELQEAAKYVNSFIND